MASLTASLDLSLGHGHGHDHGHGPGHGHGDRGGGGMGKKAPYGTWDSPITADTVVGKDNIVFNDVVVDPITQKVYHLEEHPQDGRCIIVETKTNKTVLPAPYSARTFVQEYGGAPAIVYNNVIYFSNDSGDPKNRDNGVYSLKVGESVAKRITAVNNLIRYAEFSIHPKQTHLMVATREDHTQNADGKHPEAVENTICCINMNTGVENTLLPGPGFHASPVLNPSGDRLAWQRWLLPYMPWQGSVIYGTGVTITPEKLTVDTSRDIVVAGKQGTISASLPYWVTDTTLVYISDQGENRYQSPYLYDAVAKKSTPVLKTPLAQDFAEPAWYLGLYPYAILGGGKYGAFTAFKDGANILYLINLTAPSDPVQIRWDFTVAQHVRAVNENTFVFTSSKASAPGGVAEGTVMARSSNYSANFRVLKYSGDPGSPLLKYVSQPEPMDLTGGQGQLIHAVFYKPYNPNYSGPDGEKPPCIVHVHGGPTALEPQALNWTKMYYTSRGFAWLDVNYRGSSGYGRNYIDLLYGHWGRYDVQDCYDAATALAKKSSIDGSRVAIRGGSAGSYTTLASLTFAPTPVPTFYKSACGAYGCITDVEVLAQVTGVFESKYAWTLFGVPPDNHAWDPWNPIKHADNIQVPLLLLQGLADGAVPPEIVRSFLSRSSNTGPSGSFAFYPNEGHHWHLESTIRNALAREYYWYLSTLL